MIIERIKKRYLNEEVKYAIQKYINEMDIDKNTKLSREEALAEILGVSRMTVRMVLTELEKDGVIFRKPGKCTFVNAEVLQLKVSLNPVQEFEQMIINSVYSAKVEVVNVEIKNISYHIAKKFFMLMIILLYFALIAFLKK